VKNLESVNIERMLKGLSTLAQEPRKPIDNTYQEYQRASIESLKPAFMNAIKTLYQ
jgi:type VI protein secretion system component VasA